MDRFDGLNPLDAMGPNGSLIQWSRLNAAIRLLSSGRLQHVALKRAPSKGVFSLCSNIHWRSFAPIGTLQWMSFLSEAGGRSWKRSSSASNLLPVTGVREPLSTFQTFLDHFYGFHCRVLQHTAGTIGEIYLVPHRSTNLNLAAVAIRSRFSACSRA